MIPLEGSKKVLIQPIVTLTSDFGLSDYFVGALKGVLLQKLPSLRIVDITHHLTRHDVISGAFVINEAFRYYPSGTIHVVVVDPGVGTSRRKIVVESAEHLFVGPDNGIFSYVLKEAGSQAYRILEKSLFLSEASPTFAGRDHFVPIAASLASGKSPSELGEKISDPEVIEDLFVIKNENELIGRIVYFDQYGNGITNITQAVLDTNLKQPEPLKIKVAKKLFLQSLKKNYSDGTKGKGNLMMNSSGRLEIFIPKENAKEKLQLNLLDEVVVLKGS